MRLTKYRIYDEQGEAQLGEYAKIFEEEYNNIKKWIFGPIPTITTTI